MDVRVGVDLVQVPRLQKLLADHPALAPQLFTEGERRTCGDRRDTAARLSARFAAKEAVLKALGTGLGPRMRWLDVEVVTEPWGRPVVRLHGEVAAAASRRGSPSVDVSLSHTGDLALAHAVVTVSGSDPDEKGSTCCST